MASTGGTRSRGISGIPDPDTSCLDVLVVDDEPVIAETTTEILQAEGFYAAFASTVEEGLQVLATRKVRSVILDHHLSGEDGEQFLALGRDLPPVIVVSGLGADVLAEFQAAHREQVFACLAKPVPPRHLIEVVRRVVTNRELK